jgi:hypothetical protein
MKIAAPFVELFHANLALNDDAESSPGSRAAEELKPFTAVVSTGRVLPLERYQGDRRQNRCQVLATKPRDNGGRDRDRTCDPYRVEVVLYR